MSGLRPELEPLPLRMRHLPVDSRGYPTPWFVPIINGEPEFRAASAPKWKQAVVEYRCWICGDKLGVHLAFVAGPMCGINRASGEPPAHLDCARWSARNCPFLARPHSKRREDEAFSEATVGPMGGDMLRRNPGVVLIWRTRGYRVIRDGKGGQLIEMGPADATEWWCEGRPATRDEVAVSIADGLPMLMDLARQQSDDAVLELVEATKRIHSLMPPELTTTEDEKGAKNGGDQD